MSYTAPTFVNGGAPPLNAATLNPLVNEVARLSAAGTAGRVNVKDFGAVGDGTTNDTAAIVAAAATGAEVYFPAGNYNCSPNLDLPAPNIRGAGRGQVTIILGTGARLIDSNQQWSSLQVTGITTSGGAGAVRNRYTGSNVAGHYVVENNQFLNYTGAAVEANSSDMPYWRIRNNQFNGDTSYANSKGVALGGAADQSEIANNSFLRNRVHVHLANPSNVQIVGNDFIRWSTTAPSPRIDLWTQPGATGNGSGFTVTRNKLGNENLVAGDLRIVYADAGTGATVGVQWPNLAADSTAEIDGHTITGNLLVGAGSAVTPFIYSTTPYVIASQVAGELDGSAPSYLLQFRTAPGEDARLGTNLFGPFRHARGYTGVLTTPVLLTNAVTDLGAVFDPYGVISASHLPFTGGADAGSFTALAANTSAWAVGSGATFAGTTDALGGSDATEVTMTATAQNLYTLFGPTGVVAGRAVWIEMDIGAGSSASLSEITLSISPGSYGGNAFQRDILVPTTGWRRYRFRWIPHLSGSYQATVQPASGATGSKVKVGRPRIYHGQEPVPAEPALLNVPTTATAPTAGGAGALPATPAGYLTVYVNGTARKLPYY